MRTTQNHYIKIAQMRKFSRAKFLIPTITFVLYWVFVDNYFNNHKTTVVGVKYVLENGLASTKLALMVPAFFAWLVFTIHSLFKHRFNRHLLGAFKFVIDSFNSKPIYCVISLLLISKAIRFIRLSPEYWILTLLTSLLVFFLLSKIIRATIQSRLEFEYLFLILVAVSIYTFFWGMNQSIFLAFLLVIVSSSILLENRKFEIRKSELSNRGILDSVLLPFVFILALLPINLRLNIHSFESAYFSNAFLASQGNLPWRDFLVEHGVWEDAYRYILPEILGITSLVEKNLFVETIVRPIEIFVMFACITYVLKSKPISYFVILVGAILEILIDPVNTGFSMLLAPRMFLLWPLIAIWSAYLRKKTPLSLFYLSFIAAINLMASPEGVYPLFGILLAHVVLKHKTISKEEYIWFPLKFCFTVAAVSLTILIPSNLLKYFIQNYQISGDGYAFAWGAPFNFGMGLKYQILSILVPLTIIGLMVVFTTALVMRQNVSIEFRKNLETVVIFTPLLFTGLCLYVKFLRWPDWHIVQPFSILYPLLVIIFFTFLNKNLKIQKAIKADLPKLFLVGGLALLLISFPKALSSEVPSNESKYLSHVSDSQKVVNEYLSTAENKHILDFGNEPFTWFYGGALSPAGGINKTMNILTDKSQQLAIERIKKSDPQLVILGSGYGYWSTPFENWVSKYAISQYIFENFTPFKLINGYLLMKPKEGEAINVELQNWLEVLPCNLGKVQSQFKLPRLISQRLSVVDGQVTELSNKFQVLEIQPKDFGKYEMKNLRNGGLITFEVQNSNYSGSIPLLGCPAWVFNEDSDRWKFTRVK